MRLSERLIKRPLLAAVLAVVCGLLIGALISWVMPRQHAVSPLADMQLYVDPQSSAAKQVQQWRTTDPQKAVTMQRLADQPVAKWVTAAQDIPGAAAYLTAAKAANKVAVIVVYHFPGRDCGRYSAGGADDTGEYKTFIGELAKAIGDTPAIIIVEPDTLPHIYDVNDQGQPCRDPGHQEAAFALLQNTVERFKALPATHVYLDAGNSAWVSNAYDMAERLRRAGVAKADGFSLNISNFQTLENSLKYGEELSGKIDGAHFVVDTSRSGLGPYDNKAEPAFNWCNPPGRALGHYPTTSTGHPLADAYLFIKRPGESDGADANPNKCQGGPPAGEWWPDYALGLIERWPHNLQPR